MTEIGYVILVDCELAGAGKLRVTVSAASSAQLISRLTGALEKDGISMVGRRMELHDPDFSEWVALTPSVTLADLPTKLRVKLVPIQSTPRNSRLSSVTPAANASRVKRRRPNEPPLSASAVQMDKVRRRLRAQADAPEELHVALSPADKIGEMLNLRTGASCGRAFRNTYVRKREPIRGFGAIPDLAKHIRQGDKVQECCVCVNTVLDVKTYLSAKLDLGLNLPPGLLQLSKKFFTAKLGASFVQTFNSQHELIVYRKSILTDLITFDIDQVSSGSVVDRQLVETVKKTFVRKPIKAAALFDSLGTHVVMGVYVGGLDERFYSKRSFGKDRDICGRFAGHLRLGIFGADGQGSVGHSRRQVSHQSSSARGSSGLLGASGREAVSVVREVYRPLPWFLQRFRIVSVPQARLLQKHLNAYLAAKHSSRTAACVLYAFVDNMGPVKCRLTLSAGRLAMKPTDPAGYARSCQAQPSKPKPKKGGIKKTGLLVGAFLGGGLVGLGIAAAATKKKKKKPTAAQKAVAARSLQRSKAVPMVLRVCTFDANVDEFLLSDVTCRFSVKTNAAVQFIEIHRKASYGSERLFVRSPKDNVETSRLYSRLQRMYGNARMLRDVFKA